MASALPLRAALTRGALVTLANWPIILVEFTIESVFKFALAVPVVGGAFMVAVLVGADVQSMFADGLRAAADLVVGSLGNAPAALASFVIAVLIVGGGGALVMFLVKAGTLAVLVSGERAAIDLDHAPLRFEWFRRAYAYNVPGVLEGVRRFGRRAVALGVWLGVAYAVVAGVYLAFVTAVFRLTVNDPEVTSFWPLLIAVSTSAGLVAIAAINVAYDLLRIIVVMDDCRVSVAVRRLRLFLIEDARQVIGILGVMGAVVTVATAAALLAAAGLAFVAWVPIVGWIFIPLQAAAWLIRGLVFQHMGLMTIAAYQTQYRRFAEVQPA